MRTPEPHIRAAAEQGITLIEVLVAIVLIGLVSLGMATNTIASLYVEKKTTVNYAASNLALSKVEQLSAIRVNELSSANNSTENNLTVAGMTTKFNRTTTVTVNSDQSRTIKVEVESIGSRKLADVTYTTTFSKWE